MLHNSILFYRVRFITVFHGVHRPFVEYGIIIYHLLRFVKHFLQF